MTDGTRKLLVDVLKAGLHSARYRETRYLALGVVSGNPGNIHLASAVFLKPRLTAPLTTITVEL